MAERIIILSDGTGNAASSVWRTNVWRIFQSLDLRSNTQAAKYDDGVGTSAFKPLAILGGAFGWGLKRNVIDAYKFVCRNYQPDSKIYLFGFSRGAFTARVLAGFMLHQGLVQANSEAELHDLARKAYRAYRADGYHSIWRIEIPFRALRDGALRLLDFVRGRKPYNPANNRTVQTIEFLGLWDTVAAYGLPVDEMTRGVSDWIWPLHLPDRKLSPRVLCARHALALDDERTTFHPVLWTEENEATEPQVPYSTDSQRLVQVWFTGMHANVGGGYPDDALAFVPLFWILEEAKKRGLEFKSDPSADPDTTRWIKSGQDKDGRLYDSRSGVGGYYRYGPRKVYDLSNDADAGVKISMPKIHDSVFGRIDSGANAYAPIGLPARYNVVDGKGNVTAPIFENSAQAEARYHAQERLWNFVWLRRLFYFATLAATAYLILFPFLTERDKEYEYASPIRLVSEIIRTFGSFVPGAFKWWIDWYAANPERFCVVLIVLIVLLMISARLQGKIKDAMRQIWASRGSNSPFKITAAHKIMYAIRTWSIYQWIIRTGRLRVLPFLFATAICFIAITGASHLMFNIFDSTGMFCQETDIDKLKPASVRPTKNQFRTDSLCAATGLYVQATYNYELIFELDTPWKDGKFDATPTGFNSSSLPFWDKWHYRFDVPLRRILFRPWYMAVARVGSKGVDEYFIQPVRMKDTENLYRATFKPRRSGELFLYVNDKVIGIPGLAGQFYKSNTGTANVTIQSR